MALSQTGMTNTYWFLCSYPLLGSGRIDKSAIGVDSYLSLATLPGQCPPLDDVDDDIYLSPRLCPLFNATMHHAWC